MNTYEIYVAKNDHELIVGPSLRKIGVSSHFIVTYCDKPHTGYEGVLTSRDFSLIDIRSKLVSTGLSRDAAMKQLVLYGDKFPQMRDYTDYKFVDSDKTN